MRVTCTLRKQTWVRTDYNKDFLTKLLLARLGLKG